MRVKRPHLRSSTATITTTGNTVKHQVGGPHRHWPHVHRIRKISLKQQLRQQMCGASDKDQIFTLAEIKSFLSLNLLWILQRICPRLYLADQPAHWTRAVLGHCCGWKAAEDLFKALLSPPQTVLHPGLISDSEVSWITSSPCHTSRIYTVTSHWRPVMQWTAHLRGLGRGVMVSPVMLS